MRPRAAPCVQARQNAAVPLTREKLVCEPFRRNNAEWAWLRSCSLHITDGRDEENERNELLYCFGRRFYLGRCNLKNAVLPLVVRQGAVTGEVPSRRES